MRLFGATRTALGASRDVAASASQALDLYESMWRPGPAAVTIGTADIPGLLGGVFGLDTAMMVPAFARGMNLITGVASGLPLIDLDPTTGERLQPYALTAREAMWPGRPNVSLFRVTVRDLVADGVAYWHVLARNGNGHPTAVEPIEPERVTTTDLGTLVIDGERVHPEGRYRPADVLVFDTGMPGALEHGWLTLRTAISLEEAARNYAASPLPSIALKSTGVDLSEDESQELLAAWEKARRQRSTAYLNSQVDTETFGYSAADLQLSEARSHAAVEIARLLNLDPYFCGASVGGSSVTYQNRTDLYQALLDFTVLPLLRVIEQRLSMADVCGQGRALRFDSGAFLRANLSERVAALTAYVAAGVLSPEDAAGLEPLIRRGDVPQ